MLQSQSRKVVMYLTRADQAREHARHATLKSERNFYERMERRWMDLAASTAFAERVNLFLLTVQSASLPHDACARCHGVMVTEVLETEGGREAYTLRCRDCGSTQCRSVMRYTLGRPAGRGGSGAGANAHRRANHTL